MISVDFESYYDDECSLKKMGNYAYCHHEKFDCYLVSVVGAQGIIYVGHPKGFNWESLRGETLVAHNASFDGMVMMRLQEDGLIPQGIGDKWICTADMAVFLQAPRNLKAAYKELCGKVISKAYRSKAKGKKGKDLTDDKDITDAGAADAIATYEIANTFLKDWPIEEQELSRLNREAGWYGVQIDVEAVAKDMEHIANLRQNALRLMVWADDANDTPLSMRKIREHGRKCGIMVPASLDAKSKDAMQWYTTYGESHPWVLAVRDYRRLNTIYKKLKVIRDEPSEEGIYSFAKKYFGASTGRFSGSGGFNMENLPSQPIYGIDMRSKIVPRKGHRFLCPDYSQIEARLLPWRVGDMGFLKAIKEFGNVYSAYAFSHGQHTGRDLKNENKDLYKRVKAKVLALGYAMGHGKYKGEAAKAGIELTTAEAKMDVMGYRAENPAITAFWKHHDTWLKISAHGGDASHDIVLKSGRTLRYFNPVAKSEIREREDGTTYTSVSVKAQVVRGGNYIHYYGGKLVENEIQATARDVLRDAWIALAKAGYKVLFTVHDEFIIEIPIEKCTEETRADVHRIMVNASPWSDGCPHDTESKYVDCYCK